MDGFIIMVRLPKLTGLPGFLLGILYQKVSYFATNVFKTEVVVM
jgi:hypothetical protein